MTAAMKINDPHVFAQVSYLVALPRQMRCQMRYLSFPFAKRVPVLSVMLPFGALCAKFQDGRGVDVFCGVNEWPYWGREGIGGFWKRTRRSGLTLSSAATPRSD